MNTGTLKGPFAKMLLGGKYVRRADDRPERDSQQRQVTQQPFRYDGKKFRFDFFRGLTQ